MSPRTFFTHVALALLTASAASAQPAEVVDTTAIGSRVRFGIAGGIAGNVHTAGFTALPGTPSCCPDYELGTGAGPFAALLVELPLSATLDLDVRAGYSALGATLRATESTTIDIDGRAVPVSIEHELSSSIATLAAELRASLRLTERLRLTGGARAGGRLGARFDQVERLGDDVERGAFENGRRTRNEFGGDIPDASSLDLALLAGIGYELPLSARGNLVVRPELTLAVDLVGVTSLVSWSAHQAQLGIAVLWMPPRAPAPVQVVAPPAPPPLALHIAIDAADGKAASEIFVNERVERWMSPLVPAIFFDSASTALASRYRVLSSDAAGGFALDEMARGDFVDDHRGVLNIVGYRLRRNPTASITLVGSTQRGEEPAVARGRALAVRAYLATTWGIDEARLRVATDGDPMRRADETTEDGRQENRHVTIVPSDPMIIAPVNSDRTSLQATPSALRIRPTTTGGTDLRDWRMSVRHDGSVVAQSSGEAKRTSIDPIDVSVDPMRLDVRSAERPLTVDVEVRDENGSVATATATLPIVVRQSDEWIDGSVVRTATEERITWQLVAFDLDAPEPGRVNRALLRELASAIRPGATVTIRGYTDRLGMSDRNAALASDRAASVAGILRELLGDGVRTSVRIDARGEGVDQTRFANDLPEGRILSRGVSIVVEQAVR